VFDKSIKKIILSLNFKLQYKIYKSIFFKIYDFNTKKQKILHCTNTFIHLLLSYSHVIFT